MLSISAAYADARCLSVRLFVTFVYSVEMSKHIFNFYRATHMHSADYAVARCMSVRLSVECKGRYEKSRFSTNISLYFALGAVFYSPSILTVAVSVAVCKIFSVKEWSNL